MTPVIKNIPLRLPEYHDNMTPDEVSRWLDARERQVRRAALRVTWKFIGWLFIAVLAVICLLTLPGCATEPPTATDCVLLKFPHSPSPVMVELLAETQPAADRQAIFAWFIEQNETGFILRGDHTTAIAAALAEGATAKVIHGSGNWMLVNYGKR